MAQLFDHIGEQLARLALALRLEHRLATIFDLYDLVARDCLQCDAEAIHAARSGVSQTGLPFLFAASMAKSNRAALRFLADTAGHSLAPIDRVNVGIERHLLLTDWMGIDRSAAVPLSIARWLLPRSAAARRELRRGIAWFGVSVPAQGGPELSVYVEGCWGRPHERWTRPFGLLHDAGALRSAGLYESMIPAFRAASEPLGVSIETRGGRFAIAKVYFRARPDVTVPIALDFDGIGLDEWPQVLDRCLKVFGRDAQKAPASAAVHYVSFDLLSDAFAGLKADFCNHCMGFDDETIQDRTLRLGEDLELDPSIYRLTVQKLASGRDADREPPLHEFVSIAMHRNGSPRLNAYLRPHLPRQDNKAGSRTITVERGHGTAAGRAIAYLLRRQSADGAWRDFDLEVGRSDAWVSGYVGLALACAMMEHPSSGARHALARAADWLVAARNPDGGWGYNFRCDSDADSTACALLFLRRVGALGGISAVRSLAPFHRDDGGFSTYRPDPRLGAWSQSHVDVTAMALLALAEEDRHTSGIDSVVRFLHAQQTAEGTWNSYWWRTDLYPTAISIDALAATGAVLPTAPRLAEIEANAAPNTPFEVALLLRCLVSLGRSDEAASLLERLRGMQLHDGSWRSYPTLRVTNQDVQDPWTKPNSGTVYCDDRRLFTTATVLHALLRAEPGGIRKRNLR